MPAANSESKLEIIRIDPFLEPYANIIATRLQRVHNVEETIVKESASLGDFASGHEYFGLHFRDGEWVFREWAPNATEIYLTGDFTSWQENTAYRLRRLNEHGEWEIQLPASALKHGDLYRLSLYWQGGQGERIPSYARRVVQDHHTKIFNAQVWRPPQPHQWRTTGFRRKTEALLIYEAHVGMAQEEGKVGTYREFRENILPRIVDAGYNTIQFMAIQEHPYYGSFGYHVSSFFAVSSRFGTPDEFKELVDAVHASGLAVIIDLVHSHAVKNEVEGISRFDGTEYQFFHHGSRGRHSAWDSRCFDYGKKEVIHFLLSNCRFWLDEYHVDGFRFDGITSMLYLHHGLDKSFTGYADYFNDQVDEEAIVYLTLANELIHQLRPDAMTIAEDMSGMPGMAMPAEEGGIGFDYRLGMGLPDYWIKLIKHLRDEDWHTGELWYELTNRRPGEKTVAYAESHDQALVGDQTLIFRLIGALMYSHMSVGDKDVVVDRGIALHKMIRLITLSAAGEGYLNFMGNEFGHPEWIDFPREGNNWSYHFARRQWHLRDDAHLRYRYLAEFDQAMIRLAREFELPAAPSPSLLLEHREHQILAFERAGLIFIFHFDANVSRTDFECPITAGSFELVLDSDDIMFGGHDRLTKPQTYFSAASADDAKSQNVIKLYLPTRTALVLKRCP